MFTHTYIHSYDLESLCNIVLPAFIHTSIGELLIGVDKSFFMRVDSTGSIHTHIHTHIHIISILNVLKEVGMTPFLIVKRSGLHTP